MALQGCRALMMGNHRMRDKRYDTLCISSFFCPIFLLVFYTTPEIPFLFNMILLLFIYCTIPHYCVCFPLFAAEAVCTSVAPARPLFQFVHQQYPRRRNRHDCPLGWLLVLIIWCIRSSVYQHSTGCPLPPMLKKHIRRHITSTTPFRPSLTEVADDYVYQPLW